MGHEFYHYTSKRAFEILTTHEYSWIDSFNIDIDASYGPGHYVTTLPPETPTSVLIADLWGGNNNAKVKTEYWLLISVNETYRAFRTPDERRPHVTFIPFYNRGMQGDPPQPTGWLSEPILLLKGGRRVDHWWKTVKVETLVAPKTTFVLNDGRLTLLQGVDPLLRSRLRMHTPNLYPTLSQFETELIDQSDAVARSGDLNSALNIVDNLLLSVPTSVLGLSNKGAILAALGDRKQAMTFYDQALTLDPRHVRTLVNKAGSLIKTGNYEAASACCERAIAIDEQSGAAWNNRGIALAYLKRPLDALACFDRAIEIDAALAEPWSARGGVLLKHALRGLKSRKTSKPCLEQLKQSIRSFNKALEIEPDHATARHNLRNAVRTAVAFLPDTYDCEDELLRATQVDAVVCKRFFSRLANEYIPKLHPQYADHVRSQSGVELVLRDSTLKLLADIACNFMSVWGERGFDHTDSSVRFGIHLLSDAFIHIGMPSFASRAATRMAQVVDSRGERLQLAKTLNDAGILFRKAGAWVEALHCYELAERLYDEVSDRKFSMHVKYNRAVVLRMRAADGDLDMARREFETALIGYVALRLEADAKAARKQLAELGPGE